MFPWKHFLMIWIRKISKHKEERDISGKFKKNKKERMEERKRRVFKWRFPYSCVLHQSHMPSGYSPGVTLPQENPLIWEPSLQLKIFVLLMFSVQCKFIIQVVATIVVQAVVAPTN